MRNTKFHFVQSPTGIWGGLHTLPLTYRISVTPIGDQAKYGYLAHVSDKMRVKIMATGYGEMQAHIEHIKARVGAIKKLKLSAKEEQLGLEF